MHRFARFMQLAARIFIISFMLAACGGGGGGGSKEPPDAAAPPSGQNTSPADAPEALPDVPQDWQTDREVWASHGEFQNQPGLDMINAQDAYAQGITGKGVTIGFVDTGLDGAHEEFAGKNIKLNDRSGVDAVSDSQLRHGTGVASVALGARETSQEGASGMHGVAFDADPAMWSLNLDSAGYLGLNDDILTNATRALQNSEARIINQSWGYATLLDAQLSDTQKRFLFSSYGDFIDEMRRGAAEL